LDTAISRPERGPDGGEDGLIPSGETWFNGTMGERPIAKPGEMKHLSSPRTESNETAGVVANETAVARARGLRRAEEGIFFGPPGAPWLLFDRTLGERTPKGVTAGGDVP